MTLLLHSQLTVHLLSVEMIKIKNTSIRKYCSRSVCVMHKRIINLLLYKKFKHVKISSSVCIKHKRLPNRQFYTSLHQLPAQSDGPFCSLGPKAKSFPSSVGSTNLQNHLMELGNNETSFFNKVHHRSTTSEVTGHKTVMHFFRCQSIILCLIKRKRKENEQDSIFGCFYISLLITSHHITRHMIEERLQELQHELHALQYDHNRWVWYTDWGGGGSWVQTARVVIIRHTGQDRFERSREITKDRMTQSVWMYSTAESAGHYYDFRTNLTPRGRSFPNWLIGHRFLTLVLENSLSCAF